MHINRDLSKVSMFGCNGLECYNRSFNAPRVSKVKLRVLEFYRFREVNGSRVPLIWEPE
jgi:hypothetical protein